MNIERINPVDDRFGECGGQVLEYSDNGEPIRWICGLTPEGITIHPPEANLEPDDNIHTGIEKHPETGKSCCVASIDRPEDMDIWP